MSGTDEREADGTVRKVGKQGNVYENNPDAIRAPRAVQRVLAARRKRPGDGAAEPRPEARKAVDPGGEAAPAFGAAPGAKNALNFHAWRKGGPAGDEG